MCSAETRLRNSTDKFAVGGTADRRQVGAPQDGAAQADAFELALDASRHLHDQLVRRLAALGLRDAIEVVHAERDDAERGRLQRLR